MFKLLYNLLINKYIKIIIVTLLISICFFSIYIINNYELSSKKVAIDNYYYSVTQYLTLLNSLFSIFMFGYFSLNNYDDYKKIIIDKKVKYFLIKNLIMVLIMLIIIITEVIIFSLFGYFYIGLINMDIITILETLLIHSIYYALITSIIINLYDIFNLIYISIIICFLSYTNYFSLLIVTINGINLVQSPLYYLFLIFLLVLINFIIMIRKEI